MRYYETMFIVDPDRTEEEINALLERIKKIIVSRGGEIFKEDNFGIRKMAYEIQKKRMGYYVLYQFKGEPAVKDELERNLRLFDDVLRFLVVKLEPEEIQPDEAEEQEEQPEQPEEQEQPEKQEEKN